MALIISWVLSGAIFGSVGVAMIASALYGDGPRGGIDIEAVFFRLLVTALIGAVGGGLLARAIRRRYAGNKRRLDQFALIPALLAVVLIAYGVLKP